jgi:hypothetical protein
MNIDLRQVRDCQDSGMKKFLLNPYIYRRIIGQKVALGFKLWLRIKIIKYQMD